MKDAVLTLAILPSRRLRWLVATMHLLAAAAALLADLEWPYRAAVIVAVAAGFFVSMRQPQALYLRCRADGSLNVRHGEDWLPAELLPDTLVLSWLAVLRYRPDGEARPKACVILPDSLERDDFRQLRVWLRWRGRGKGD
jgi:toxin CptA